jgi:hypothetical protein
MAIVPNFRDLERVRRLALNNRLSFNSVVNNGALDCRSVSLPTPTPTPIPVPPVINPPSNQALPFNDSTSFGLSAVSNIINLNLFNLTS